MKEIDGSAGGGQILRSALSLAAVTQTPVRVTGIRGDRSEPGLKHQHLTVVETLAEITNATVTGASYGATSIEFEPGVPRGGEYSAAIGTAGSITLLFDAVLPLASAIDEPLVLTASGGTEVKWSPPLIVQQQVKFPLLRKWGLWAAMQRQQTGFYPAGGGSVRLRLQPATFEPLNLGSRGDLIAARCYSIISQELAESAVGTRLTQSAREQLENREIPVESEQIQIVATKSAGAALAIELEYEHSRAAVDRLGETGVPAEDVAQNAVDDALAFHDSGAPIDRHLADQLLVVLALAGGEIEIPAVTDHVESSLALLSQFEFDVELDELGPNPVVTASESERSRL